MVTDGYIWEDASVTYPDWVGTAQLDQRMTVAPDGQPPGIEERLGSQLDGWMVIGIDIGGGEHEHSLRVIAIPEDSVPPGGDVIPKYAESQSGEVLATEFLVHDVDPYEFGAHSTFCANCASKDGAKTMAADHIWSVRSAGVSMVVKQARRDANTPTGPVALGRIQG